jgi:hypothetical protein
MYRRRATCSSFWKQKGKKTKIKDLRFQGFSPLSQFSGSQVLFLVLASRIPDFSMHLLGVIYMQIQTSHPS